MPGKIKRVFPGGNTSEGFFSYYNYVIGNDANRLFVIKGGPGVGKSSFMKSIAVKILEKGYNVEFHHCSSDNNSIDGIVVPKLKVAMVDGTAPHVVDPKNPGAVDEIINLGEYWDVDNMEERKKDIISVNAEIGKLFKRAYRYFESAKPIYNDIEVINKEAMDFGKVNVATYKLINEIFNDIPVSNNSGKVRHLFGSAYTPNGWVEFTDSILEDCSNIYRINGNYGTGKSTLLTKVCDEAVASGFQVELYHTPFIPYKVETLYIKNIDVGITISDLYKDNNKMSINLNNYLNIEIINKYRQQLEEDKKVFNSLIKMGISNITKAKQKHDELEKYYISNMDFDRVDILRKKILKRIFKYEN